MSTQTITKSVLMLSAPMIMGIAYTPVAKARPSKDFIDQHYISNGHHSPYKSERRKQLLNTIREAKRQIALTHQEMQAIDKTIDCCIQGITEKSQQRINNIISTRAKELRVPVKYIKADQVAKRKGIVIINNFEIEEA